MSTELIRRREPFVRLNRKIADLRQVTPVVERLRPHRLVLFGGYHEELISRPRAPGARAISPVDLEAGDWLNHLEARPVAAEDLEVVRSALVPTLVFNVRSRRGASDPGKSARRQRRTLLDARQAAAAAAPVEDVLLISGPPGGGKTLVLAGRARFLASKYPDWRIAILCFNNALVPHLRRLVVGYGNIEVHTFGKFAHRLGHRIALDTEERAKSDVDLALSRGVTPVVDALLIDEAQDFLNSWIRFALATVRPGRGGAVLVSDERQALYRDEVEISALTGRRVEQLCLDRSYRSTRQILRAAIDAHPGVAPVADGDLPDGEPIDLIWATTWNGQAAATAWEVRRMLDETFRVPGDIAILVTQRRGTIGRLRAALDRVAVPYLEVNRENAASFDPDSSEVKVMTVHTAKGYEFDVVVLFGLEALPHPDGRDPAHDREATRRGRVGFVGMTRARDQLLVTYTRDNPYLDRLQRSADVRTWTWPDDYEVE